MISRRHSNFSTRAFTLIELMVVIGIIGIMLVAVVPAVVSLNKANSGKSAVSSVMNLLEQARALAVTSGQATYVVFADQTTQNEAYRCKALIVFQDDQNFAPGAITKWHFLPTGISFFPGVGMLTPQAGTPILKFACPGTITPPGQTIALPFVKFDPSGMVTVPTDPNILFTNVFSGSVNASGQPAYTDKAQATSQKFDSVVVARFTGRARYVDPYAP